MFAMVEHRLRWVCAVTTHWFKPTQDHETGFQQMMSLHWAQFKIALAASELLVSVGHEIAFAVDDDRGAFNPFRAVF